MSGVRMERFPAAKQCLAELDGELTGANYWQEASERSVSLLDVLRRWAEQLAATKNSEASK